jgi:1,4-alpha-glucan branching enzyme
MYLVDKFHEAGIGVILDWVPSHFPTDGYALANFDGTALYEHADPRKGFHPDWGSYIFNYGRNEVRSFLISNALFWLDKYHADGLRVDAVASMLYLDYSRKEGEWIPNVFGGRENLEAISFLREMNEAVYINYPDVQTIAEESTAFPGVSRPVFLGGLGFGMKWMMGWMHDTLKYFKENPLFRAYHHGSITFSLVYAFSENFMLPLSHDEVVHGKGALIDRMPGDDWQRFANMRLLYGYMFTHPGNKLMFMGDEFGQTSEWKHDYSVEWHLTQYPLHAGLQKLVKDLNFLFRKEKALHQIPFSEKGFEWIDLSDYRNSVLVYMRKGEESTEKIIVACNFTPIVRENYRFGIPAECNGVREILNTDKAEYGGSGVSNPKIKIESIKAHNRDKSIAINLPPLGVSILKLSFPEKLKEPKSKKEVKTETTKETKPKKEIIKKELKAESTNETKKIKEKNNLF